MPEGSFWGGSPMAVPLVVSGMGQDRRTDGERGRLQGTSSHRSPLVAFGDLKVSGGNLLEGAGIGQ